MRIARRAVFAAAAATLSLAGVAQAQGPLSTGSFVNGRDLNWDVSVAGGAFFDAYQVVNNPGWNDFNGPTAARWISYNASATGPGGTPYTFQTTFNLTGYDPTTASLSFQCGMDNSIVGILLNGSSLVGATCVYHNLSGIQTISSGFTGGVNTLQFVVSGDQITDGFIYNTTAFSARQLPSSSVPEPSTYALMATGLLGLATVARRRQSR